jgi:DNA-binding CsgD family transcriptional regulator
VRVVIGDETRGNLSDRVRPSADNQQAASLRRARIEYTVRDGRLIGTLTLPRHAPREFQSASELERLLGADARGLVLVDASATPGEGPAPADALDGIAGLTPVERAIVERALHGASNREIAGSLYYSVKSIEAYLTRIYRRLGIESRNGLAAVVGAADDLDVLDGDAELIGGGASVQSGLGSGADEPAVVELLLVA